MHKTHKLPKLRTLAAAASMLMIIALLVSACGTPGLPAAPSAPDPANTPDAAVADTGNAQAPAAGTDVRSKGKADAPVTIVEYSDFQCPFCSRWFEQTYETLAKEYIDTGKVRLEFRDFPLAQIHPNAQGAAVASRCAAEQGAYWEMHDKLFGSQSEWASLPDPKETFGGYASALGLDQAAFAACLTSGKFDQAIQDDLQAGQAAGVTGTPSFLINGEPLVGARPTDDFRKAIDTVLAGGKLADYQPTAVPQQPAGPPQPLDIPLGNAPVKGDANAPLTIVEYSDFQCPFCSRFTTDTLGTLLDEYVNTGKARLVYKDFPLDQIHPQATKAAEAARCVRELGGDEAFWAMHDKLYAGQQEWSGNEGAVDIFARYAGEVGVDAAKVKACVESGKQTTAVQTDLQEGIQLGVTGTPTFFINGQPFVGARPIDQFRSAIADVEQGKSIVPPTPTPVPTPAPLTEDIPLDDAAGIKGSAAAPITIVEYSDYQCPFCERHFQEVLPQLQQYIDNGTVRYVFKDFPLTQIHPQAPKAAEAARCAGDQDYYWQMHDLLFQNQQQWSGQATALDTFKGFAKQLNLNQATFDQCLDSGKHAAVIAANEQEGISFGVSGTPYFFINGQRLEGAFPIESFQEKIEAGLKAKGQ